MNHRLFIAALFSLALLAGCGKPSPESSVKESREPSTKKLVIKGSDTLGAKLIPQLAEAFRDKHPEVDFEIAAEGSSTGIAALINGTAHIAMSSREVKQEESADAALQGITFTPVVVAFDGIGVIVNHANPLKSLSLEQVEQVFTGDLANWESLGGSPAPISIYTRNTASGTYADFKKLAMSKREYSPEAQKLAGNEQIASEVASNPNGIGYVGLAYLTAEGIKPLAVNDQLPKAEAIQAKLYPLSRPTFLVTNAEPQGIAKKFIDFVFTPEGRSIVERVGFVPVQ